MADSKISQLQAVAEAMETDEIVVNQGGVSKKMSLSQLATLLKAEFMESVLHRNTGSVATTGTVEETLMSYSLPANTLNSDGRGVRITAWGSCAVNANTKISRVKFGSTAVASRNAADNGTTWVYDVIVLRTGAATQEAINRGFIAASVMTIAKTSPNATLSGAVTIAVTGETATSAGDLTCEGLLVELLP